jgi:hypothetical protein
MAVGWYFMTPLHTHRFIAENLLPQALEFVRAGEWLLREMAADGNA